MDVVTESARWRQWLFSEFYKLIHHREEDNFDVVRFRGIDPQTFFYEEHATYLAFLVDNIQEFFRARCLLVDDESKDLFDRLILYRLLGHLHVRLPFDHVHDRQQAATVSTWKVSDSTHSGMFGPLSIFSVPVEDRSIRVNAWPGNVLATFMQNQYYLHRPNINVAVSPGDHVIDAGGCFGDTALRFAYEVGAHGRVYTFDPIKEHCDIMREAFAMNPDLEKRLQIFEFGLSDSFHDGKPGTGGINPGAQATSDLPLQKIDALSFPAINFIKMDIEGSELSALKGAERSIRKWLPKLAISLYHRREDLFTIPLWIDALDCGYRCYLGHYSMHREETILYASSTR